MVLCLGAPPVTSICFITFSFVIDLRMWNLRRAEMGCWESQWLKKGHPHFTKAVLGYFYQLSTIRTLEAHGIPTAQLALFNVSSIRSHLPTVPSHKGWKETYHVLHTGFILNQINTGRRLFIKQRHNLPWQELWLTIVLNNSWYSVDATS